MRGDRLMRIGLGLLIVGIGCTLVAISPLVYPDLKLPSYWWALSMLTGVGLALILFGLRRSSQSRRLLK